MKKFKKRLFQFTKFAFVGVLNAIISWSVYAVCIRIGIHYIPATAIGFSISMINATFWNRRVVFKDDRQPWWRSFVKTYIAYSVTALFLNSLLLHLWIDVLQVGRYFVPAYKWLLKRGIRVESGRRLAEYIAPFFNYCITVPLNYVLNKFWAFGLPKEKDRPSKPEAN